MDTDVMFGLVVGVIFAVLGAAAFYFFSVGSWIGVVFVVLFLIVLTS